MVLDNDLQTMQSLMQSLIKLTHANCELTAANKELTDANYELTAQNKELTDANCKLTHENSTWRDRCSKQSKQLRDMMQQKQLMMETFDEKELENSKLLDFLRSLTPVLKNCKDEAEEAALALTAAQNPTQQLFEQEHASLLKELRTMRALLRSAIHKQTAAETKAVDASAELSYLQKRLQQLQREAEPQSLQIQKFFRDGKTWTDKNWTDKDWDTWVRNASIQGTYFRQETQINNTPVYMQHMPEFTKKQPMFIVKNNEGQWTVMTSLEHDAQCMAIDPVPKMAPWNCDWHEWCPRSKQYLSMARSHPWGFCA
jgi:hypothetical protein